MSAEGALCPVCAGSIIDDDLNVYAEPGTFAGGFAAGFFGGCIGLGLVMMIAKGEATKKGAGIGFGIQLFIGLVLRVLGS